MFLRIFNMSANNKSPNIIIRNSDTQIPEYTGSTEVHVGQKIHNMRKVSNLSLRALAQRSNINVNTLSLIENGKTSPSVSTLQALAGALNVPIVTFFEAEIIQDQIVFTRNKQRPQMTSENALIEILGKGLAGNGLQPLIVTLAGGEGCGQNTVTHSGYEFVYCLSGKVLYYIDDKTYLLESGDSIVFQSELPHRWQNVSEDPSQIILVICPSNNKYDDLSRYHYNIA